MWFRLLRLGQFEALDAPLTKYYLYSNSLSSNPALMLDSLGKMMDTTLLSDLRGLNRWAWRRRILAAQLCSAGLIARDNQLKGELMFMIRAVLTWPSPFWAPRRFAMFAVSFRNMFR